MNRIAVAVLLGLGCGIAGNALAADALPEPANKVVDYHKDIAPIFADRCVKCHGEEKQKSDYRLDNREDAIGSGSEGAAIAVGDSANSLMVKLLVGADENFDLMPPKGDPLTPEQIGLIRAWIDQGAVWEGSAPSAGAAAELNDKTPFTGLGEQWFVEATAQKGPLATWTLVDEKGPAGEACVALTQVNDDSDGTYNLLWDSKTQFKNGRIETSIKAVSGETDQGGGLVWRAKDKNNYYIARFNPIEKNLRLYQVIEGKREQLASADVEKPAGAWVALVVEQQENHIKVSLDGAVLLEADAAALNDAGGVGLWTKADAATVFTLPAVQTN
jgi:hypothetical protein